MIATMLRCHWAGARLERYLDRDPSAPLTTADITTLERHLDACARCARKADLQRTLNATLARWAAAQRPSSEVLARAQRHLARLGCDDPT